MPYYRIRRHVIYKPGCGQTEEVWGIDRLPAGPLLTAFAPPFTDRDDPLLGDAYRCSCTILLKFPCGDWVTWHRFWEWISYAESVGYELVSDFKDISPYSVIVLKGP